MVNNKHLFTSKKIDIPFERKPRLARKNSQKFAENENKKYTEFKPIGLLNLCMDIQYTLDFTNINNRLN